jgi:Uma2 family endonuclease
MVAVEKLKLKTHFKYEDLLSWNDDVRYELFNGVPVAMTAPLTIHQDILLQLATTIHSVLKGKKCKLFIAPSDVILDDCNVFQPDLYVNCDQSKEHERGCTGAPDLIIEITSPSTAGVDYKDKYLQYLKAGVKEYWIVEPERRLINVFLYDKGKYVHSVYGDTGIITSVVIKGLNIDLTTIFEPQKVNQTDI